MVDELRTKRNKAIKDIFKEMIYEDTVEDVSKAVNWMKSKGEKIVVYNDENNEHPTGSPFKLINEISGNHFCTIYIPLIDTVNKILSESLAVEWIKIDFYKRAKILNKFAEEIERNADIISQIEVISKGILSKDTKNKVVPLLAQYFYYYSNFAVVHHEEDANWKPKGIAVGIFSNRNALSNVGLMLAPALAAGYNIVLQVGTKLTPVVSFLLELAKNAGIPEEVIKLIPSDAGKFLPTISGSKNTVILTVFDDLHDKKYLSLNGYNHKILNLASYKIPLIVFESADLESASTNTLESAYSYQGLLPWSVDTVLVQENVLEPFLEKLKSKLISVTKGSSYGAKADIAYPSFATMKKLRDFIDRSHSLGIEVFQVSPAPSSPFPTLFIGGKIETNRVLGPDDHEANALYILPFRTIDEGIQLANNTRQGLAASIWTENVGVMNEAVRKLRVSNIWVNGHGLTAADVTLSPIKDSGIGYFGGREGFYEYVHVTASKPDTGSNKPADTSLKLVDSVVNAINSAKKAQESWCKISRFERAKILRKGFIRYIEDNMESLSKKFNELWLVEWITFFYTYSVDTTNSNDSISQSGYTVNTIREPRGVVAIEILDLLQNVEQSLILSALLEGNSVLLLDRTGLGTSIFQELSDRLPNGVLKVVPYNITNAVTAIKHKGLDAYFAFEVNSVFANLPKNETRIFTNLNMLLGNMDFKSRVTFCKNVWSNVGKSSNCNL